MQTYCDLTRCNEFLLAGKIGEISRYYFLPFSDIAPQFGLHSPYPAGFIGINFLQLFPVSTGNELFNIPDRNIVGYSALEVLEGTFIAARLQDDIWHWVGIRTQSSKLPCFPTKRDTPGYRWIIC